MKKSKVFAIVAITVCGVLLIGCVLFVLLKPQVEEQFRLAESNRVLSLDALGIDPDPLPSDDVPQNASELEESNSKLFSSWVEDANKTIDKLDKTKPTGGASDAYYQAFVHFYGPWISGQDGSQVTRVLLPSDAVSMPDKDVLYDKIKKFCKKYKKEVVEGTYESFKEQGYIQGEDPWSMNYDGVYIRLSSHDGYVTEGEIEIMTGSQAGNMYTFEKKNGTWELTKVSEWMS